MKFFQIILSLVIAILIFSCQEDTQDGDIVTLKGSVYYVDNNNQPKPVEDALINIKEFFAQTTSDANGDYSLEIEPSEEEIEVTIEASKVGFQVAQVSALAQKGQQVQVADITLQKITQDTVILPIDTTTVSGDAAHIEVYGKHDSHIYVRSSGLSETAIIHFLVTDNKGIPVDSDHKATVQFSILNGPDGGEYLYPQSMETENGLVYTILNSGSISGAVQILAQTTVNGDVIRALPIRIAVYGGLPDDRHFSVGLDRVNIAGRVHFGILDYVTAFVGDKFSNPVAPGTIVYFETDYGIIEGAALTDEMGRATVRYMSAQPLPPNPADSSYAHIRAHTFTDTLIRHQIDTRARLLLSDVTAPIVVSPNSFTYNELNNPVKFDYEVKDIWGNPVVGGSRINVSPTDGEVYGDVNFQMLDTQAKGPGATQFSFTWAPGDSLEAPQVYISISVDPPPEGNGYRSTSVLGSKE